MDASESNFMRPWRPLVFSSGASRPFLTGGECIPLSGNGVKQDQLPLNNRRQGHDEKDQEGFHPEFFPENVGLGDTQDQDNRCAGEQILYRKKWKGAPIQVISHDRVQFARPPAHQIKGEEGIRNREEDHKQGRCKNLWAMTVGEREISHFSLIYK